jgi:hypothetical protein
VLASIILPLLYGFTSLIAQTLLGIVYFFYWLVETSVHLAFEHYVISGSILFFLTGGSMIIILIHKTLSAVSRGIFYSILELLIATVLLFFHMSKLAPWRLYQSAKMFLTLKRDSKSTLRGMFDANRELAVPSKFFVSADEFYKPSSWNWGSRVGTPHRLFNLLYSSRYLTRVLRVAGVVFLFLSGGLRYVALGIMHFFQIVLGTGRYRERIPLTGTSAPSNSYTVSHDNLTCYNFFAEQLEITQGRREEWEAKYYSGYRLRKPRFILAPSLLDRKWKLGRPERFVHQWVRTPYGGVLDKRIFFEPYNRAPGRKIPGKVLRKKLLNRHYDIWGGYRHEPKFNYGFYLFFDFDTVLLSVNFRDKVLEPLTFYFTKEEFMYDLLSCIVLPAVFSWFILYLFLIFTNVHVYTIGDVKKERLSAVNFFWVMPIMVLWVHLLDVKAADSYFLPFDLLDYVFNLFGYSVVKRLAWPIESMEEGSEMHTYLHHLGFTHLWF